MMRFFSPGFVCSDSGSQFTVSENVVACDSDPEVAVTVTVDVTGPGLDDPPPHPLRRVRAPRQTVQSSIAWIARRLFHPRQQMAMAKVAPGRAEPGCAGLAWRWLAAAVADVVMVTVVDDAPGGVMLAGEKAHEAPAGRPDEQAKVMADANPPCGETAMEAVALPPAVTVRDAGVAAREKSDGMVMT
jgi:hypothetical protein